MTQNPPESPRIAVSRPAGSETASDPIETARERLATFDNAASGLMHLAQQYGVMASTPLRPSLLTQRLAEDVRALLGLLDEGTVDARCEHDDLSEITLRDGLFVCATCGKADGIEQPPTIGEVGTGAGDAYQPCNHECNGCPTCDPGLTPEAPAQAHLPGATLSEEERGEILRVPVPTLDSPRRPDGLQWPIIDTVERILATRLAAQPESATRAKAEAVRAVRDKWQWGAWIEAPKGGADDDPMQRLLAHGQYVTDWLTERANEIEAG